MPTPVIDSAFEIRVRSGVHNVSRVFTLPTGVQSLPRGTALMEHDSADETATERSALLANPNGVFLGFLVRGVRDETTDTGRLQILEEQSFPRGDIPDASGAGVSLETGEVVEVEGADYLLGSGAGAITTGTVEAGATDQGTTYTSFVNGKFAIAQSGQRKEFVIAKVLTPATAGNVRLRLNRVHGA